MRGRDPADRVPAAAKCGRESEGDGGMNVIEFPHGCPPAKASSKVYDIDDPPRTFLSAALAMLFRSLKVVLLLAVVCLLAETRF